MASKAPCKYGNKCYRKNQQHLQSYSHPSDKEEKEETEKKPTLRKTRSEEVKKNKQKRTITDFFATAESTEEDVDSGSVEFETPPKKQKVDKDEATTEQESETTCNTASPSQEKEVAEEEDDAAIEAPSYPEDVRECIKQEYMLDMPEDFYQFWDFCKACNKADPSMALYKSLGLRLSGPYDILSGRHKQVKRNKHRRRPNFLLHQRFFYDPPEFQTVLVSDEDSKFHIGYFRDDPREMPVFMASNFPAIKKSKKQIRQCGDNIFAAVHLYAELRSKAEKGGKKKLMEDLANSLEKEAKKLNLSLVRVTKAMKLREKKVNCATFHEAGMVVPVDANDVGYRPVPESYKRLQIIFLSMVEFDTEAEKEKASEELQEIITLVQFANDECDYGEGLELGLCLFTFGHHELHPQISLLLPLAYMLLRREQFKKVIEAHLDCRRPVEESVDELET